LNETTERKVSRHHHHHLLKTYTYINASKRSLSSNERNDIIITVLRVNNSALEFPFATKEKGEIVFNSIHVDPPINTSRTTKELRLEEKIIRAKITAIDARSLRSAVVGLIDSVALVVETVERCER
jgi:tRNA threonylcarbamoyladenosine modification (KEOPS) complex  Pcc1 subunit